MPKPLAGGGFSGMAQCVLLSVANTEAKTWLRVDESSHVRHERALLPSTKRLGGVRRCWASISRSGMELTTSAALVHSSHRENQKSDKLAKQRVERRTTSRPRAYQPKSPTSNVRIVRC